MRHGAPADVQALASLATPEELAGSKYQFGTVHEAGMIGVEPAAPRVFGFAIVQRQDPSAAVHAAASIWACERVSGEAAAMAADLGLLLKGNSASCAWVEAADVGALGTACVDPDGWLQAATHAATHTIHAYLMRSSVQ